MATISKRIKLYKVPVGLDCLQIQNCLQSSHNLQDLVEFSRRYVKNAMLYTFYTCSRNKWKKELIGPEIIPRAKFYCIWNFDFAHAFPSSHNEKPRRY